MTGGVLKGGGRRCRVRATVPDAGAPGGAREVAVDDKLMQVSTINFFLNPRLRESAARVYTRRQQL